MDYIRFHCPFCNHLLVVPPEASGLSGPCPECLNVITGPNHYTPPQPQPLNPPQERAPNPPLSSTAIPEPVVLPTQTQQSPTRLQSPASASSPPYEQAPPPAAVQPQPEAIPQPQPQPQPEPEPRLEQQPEPEEDPNPLKIESSRPRGLSFLQATALCFFSSAAFFALGFFLGKTGAISWEEILNQPTLGKEVNEESQVEAKPPEGEITLTPLPQNPSNEQGESEHFSEARACLEAFLDANTWTARSAYVLNPNSMLPLMEACAQAYGDEAIECESISLEQDGTDQKVFWVKTKKNNRPFSTVLIKEGANWRVEWTGFADFYYERLNGFATGKSGPMQGNFRVTLKAAPGETSPLSPGHCIVSTPQSSDTYQISSAAGSSVRRELAEIFQAYIQADAKTFKDAMALSGIPLVVEISRSGAQNPTLTLERIVATTWALLPPDEMKKNSSCFH